MLLYECRYMKKVIIVLILFLFQNLYASNIGEETGLKIPRYVSLKSDNTNLRIGPNVNYPIIINYQITNFPVMVIDEYDDWRKIKDFENNVGWLHKSLIKGERYAIISRDQNKSVHVYNSVEGGIIGEIFNKNVVKLLKCKNDWCLIKIKNHSGWIDKQYLWGTMKDETLNINFMQSIYDIFWKSINMLTDYFY